MKKLYSTPAMEVKAFDAEDIMTTSSTTIYDDTNVGTYDNTVVDQVTYSDLFGL